LEKWKRIFAYGEEISSTYQFTEKDIDDEIQTYRKEQAQNDIEQNYKNSCPISFSTKC
jgi:hypothetical protein